MNTTIRHGWPVIIAAVGILLLSPFVPLLLAIAEFSLFGSNHVEEFCRTIGIHDLLSKLYEPLHPLLRYLVG